MNPRSRAFIYVVFAVLAAASLITIAWKGPASPAGRYTADPNIGIEGDFWWELSNGKVELIGGGTNIYSGRYTNMAGKWFWVDDHSRRYQTNIFRIDSTWWRLRMEDQKTGEGYTWGVRRFW